MFVPDDAVAMAGQLNLPYLQDVAAPTWGAWCAGAAGTGTTITFNT